ncbi:HPF/RaiA family ribosome-associated protein [Ectothiorhodospiraceae bacterium WFHF3C12]|nr:HPF/RaiA family ribosome-associated protein [Ectothiorhodospiraceae bacterium WFHF3C12]
MQIPVQVTFRNMDSSPAVEDRVRSLAEKLERYYDNITSCRVVVETHHQHHHKGNLHHARIDVTVPGGELVVGREPGGHHAHEDVHVAVRDAFDAMRRQLEDFARKQRGKVKHHEVPPHGRVREVFPDEGYGVIETPDGREIRFWRNSVVEADISRLSPGDEVRFTESENEDGPVASTVHVVGKHHVAG